MSQNQSNTMRLVEDIEKRINLVSLEPSADE
jgi:hypothetical protein